MENNNQEGLENQPEVNPPQITQKSIKKSFFNLKIILLFVVLLFLAFIGSQYYQQKNLKPIICRNYRANNAKCPVGTVCQRFGPAQYSECKTYLFSFLYQFDPQHGPQVMSQPLPEGFTKQITPTTTIDQTSTWKTYTNAQYGFSLKYPNNWNQIDLTDKNSDYLPGVLLTPQSQKPQDGKKVLNMPGVYIYTLEIKDCINSGDYSQKEMNTYINNKDLYPGLKIRKINLNNIYGYIIDEGAPGVTAQKGLEAFIFQCPTEIQISFDPTGIDNSIKLFDQILSTFQFTP